MPIKHPKWRWQIGSWIYEFWEEVQARAIIWGVISLQMAFKARKLDEISTREECIQIKEGMLIQLAAFSGLLPWAGS